MRRLVMCVSFLWHDLWQRLLPWLQALGVA